MGAKLLHATGLERKLGERTMRYPELSVSPGNLMLIKGANGSGKSTLLRMLCGVLAPCRGVIQRKKDIRIGVHFVTSHGLSPSLSVKENICYSYALRGFDGPNWRQDVSAILVAMQLDDIKHKLPFSLSSGQRQRVSLAAAMVGTPDLVVLDEPSVTLDTEARRVLEENVARLRQRNTAFLVSSHDALLFENVPASTLNL